MKFNNPFGVPHSLEVEAEYNTGPTRHDGTFKLITDTATIKVKPGSVDTITISFQAKYYLRIPTQRGDTFMMDTNGSFGFYAQWEANFGENSVELGPKGTQPKALLSPTRKGPIVVAAYAKMGSSKVQGTKPFVQLDVELVCGEEDQLKIGLQDGSPPHPTSIAHYKVKGSLKFTFHIDVEVIKAKVKKDTIVVGSFEFGEHDIKKVKAISGMLDFNKLKAWYNGLPDRTRNKIEQEQKPPGDKFIVMKGFTDNVGEEHKNVELGKKRAVAVAEAFQTISGVPWKKIITAPGKGEQDNPQENKRLEKKEPKHRRVEFEMLIEE